MPLFYRMQFLFAAYALFVTSFISATSTSSKEEIKCETCIPVSYPSPPPPPPLVIDCPPPPSLPPPSPPPPKPTPSPPPACPSCAPPCNLCQTPTTPGVIGGGFYSPPDQVVPYFPYSYQYPPPSESAASSSTAHTGLKLLVPLILLILSATYSQAQLGLYSN
ncbi:hypothetical protein HRI_004590100 [Hibiscus trionum]|uniref:Uncharacterized protein n=1 Tax=Hibiscus trionum TaxID=183268 RepID=A0A9W7JCI9_HIBTR|nr:hypothetical protein HRI_004590100 [Hibiscus trionum]